MLVYMLCVLQWGLCDLLRVVHTHTYFCLVKHGVLFVCVDYCVCVCISVHPLCGCDEVVAYLAVSECLSVIFATLAH